MRAPRKNTGFQYITLGLGLLLVIFSPISEVEGAKKKKTERFRCNYGPEIVQLNPVFLGRDGCTGSVHIQGKMYGCCQLGDVSVKTIKNITTLNRSAAAACKAHCQERSGNCKSVFNKNLTCGHKVPQSLAMKMGKSTFCTTNCNNPAFHYCSLYRGSYLQVMEEEIVKFPANCKCYPKKN